MSSIWVGLCPSARTRRILAMRRSSETILERRLSRRPSSARAVTALFEAIVLWERMAVRAVLAVDGSSMSPSPTTLYRNLFEVLGESTPLYPLDSARLAAGRRRRLTGLGDFRDLERLLAHTVAR